MAVGTTGTGLDELLDIIETDPGLQSAAGLTPSELAEGAAAADALANLLVEALAATDAGVDWNFSSADMRAVNAYLQDNHGSEWATLYGVEGSDESGFRLVGSEGASTSYTTDGIYYRSAIDFYLDGFLMLGNDIEEERVTDWAGRTRQPVHELALWLAAVVQDDIAEGRFGGGPLDPVTPGDLTGTGLDQLTNAILYDEDLLANEKITELKVEVGAYAANEMNHLLLTSIAETGSADDGAIQDAEIYDINAHIQSNFGERFLELHGDHAPQRGEETGYHIVYQFSSTENLFGLNAIISIGHGIYSLGFDIIDGRLVDEASDRSYSVGWVATYLNRLLSEEDFESISALDTTSSDPTPIAPPPPPADEPEPVVPAPPPADALVFDGLTPTSGQDEDNAVGLAAGATSATLSGNTWGTQALDEAVEITADTVARFEIAILDLGEIQGIGFDDDAGWSLDDPFQALFKLAGTQDGAASVDESLEDTVAVGDGFVEVEIGLGAFAGDDLSHVHLINDQDGPGTAEMTIANLVVEGGDASPPPPADAVVFDALTPTSGQDEDTLVEVSDDGTTATLTDNTWVTQELDTAVEITADTVARFEVAIGDRGEIHGIGFDDDAGWSMDDPFQALFKLAGTDDAMSVDDSLDGVVAVGDGFVEVQIALGAFAGNDLSHVHLINDHDDGISSQMTISELVIGDADTLVG